MKCLIAYLLFLTSFVAASPLTLNSKRQEGFPEPLPVSGNLSNCHDPSIVKHQTSGKWYRFCSNAGRYFSSPGIGGPWTYVGSFLPNGSKLQIYNPQPASDIWAPDASYVDGAYHVYDAISETGKQNSEIGVATSTTMDAGSWTDHGSTGIPKDLSSAGYNEIDPNLFHDGDTRLLQFGSYWRDIFQTQMDNTFLKQAPNAGPPSNIAYNSTRNVTEGSFLFANTVGETKYYYLFFSSGACCQRPPTLPPQGQEYKVMVCRSSKPTGPFTDKAGRSCLNQDGGTLVLGSHGDHVYAPGGQSVVADNSLKAPVMYYHYVDPTIQDPYQMQNFKFGYNYLDFSSGWPVVTA
ncbi:endo-alpha-1,5-arabinanase precursor [Rhizodiscina lignyota]|uniref:Arabinan endo-1,5-alpha-L-arabinosidase n=1 Tax=Rhizodiscina lignyota TaxID=1504668 RepID=A0A9P4IGF2_9PEZI|nr:endo-alpha-1,5-arabinanase precursor [Rhizodiscina lignyota]